MIKAGAFDSLETNRNTLLCSFENIIDMISIDRKKALSGQINMFDTNAKSTNEESLYRLIPQMELEKKYLLSMEKEVLGLYVSGHPLDNLVDVIDKFSTLKSTDLLDVENEEGESIENLAAMNKSDGKNVRFIGIISEVKTKITKNNEIMAFVTIEDLEGTISTIAFPRTYAGYKNVIFEDNIVMVDGRINVREDEINVMISKIETYETRALNVNVARQSSDKKIKIVISEKLSPDELTELRNFIKLIGNQRTNTELEITNKGVSKIVKVFVNEKIYSKLQELAGKENVTMG